MSRIVGIKGSPRKGSNSTILMEQVLAGAGEVGAQASIITPWRMNIGPCLACGACYTDGRCTIQDDFQDVYDQIEDADGLVLASPVYFGAVSAQVKILIDRCESFWSLRNILGEALPPSGLPRLGVLIATAGKDMEIMFKGPRTTFGMLMNACQGEIYDQLFYGGLDEPRSIRNSGEAMERALMLGHSLAHELGNRKGTL